MNNYKPHNFIILLIIVCLALVIFLIAIENKNSQEGNQAAAITITAVVPATAANTSISAATQVPVRIFIGGDIMLDRSVRNLIITKGFESIFSDVRGMLLGKDISVANLEGPFTNNDSQTLIATTGRTTRSLQFTFDPALAPKLQNVGFTMFGLANNHTENYGTEGLDDTRQYLIAAGLAYYGDPENAIDISTTTTVRGMTVAFIGFHEFSYKNVQNVYDEIARLRPVVNYIIVSPHWGVEYQATSTTYQRELAYAFIDHGADAVIGAHPHVIEQFETYKGKPIFYSLGNFVFDQNSSFETTHGLTLELDLTQKNILSPVAAEITLLPITIDNSHPELASSTIRADILQHLAAMSSTTSEVKSQILQGKISVDN